MGSSMAKSRRSEYYDHRCRAKGVGSHFSKEYTEYWKRPNANKSNFSMEKNEYSYFSNDDFSPTKNNTTRYATVVSSFR